ncbi:hypothetical protein Tco_1302422 [Tanacetum coccineum]
MCCDDIHSCLRLVFPPWWGVTIEVGERLVLFQEVIDDDFGESEIWHVLASQSLFFSVINLVSKVFPNQFRIIDIFFVKHPPQYVNSGLSEFVIASKLSREALPRSMRKVSAVSSSGTFTKSTPSTLVQISKIVLKNSALTISGTSVDMVKALKHVEFLIMSMIT